MLPEEHTVMVRQTSKWGQIFLLTLVGVGATAFATACIYRLDEIVTVTGRLVPKDGGVEVKSPISGTLEKIFVTNGETIKKYEPLVKFNVKAAKNEETTIKVEMKLEQKRLTDELKNNFALKETINRTIELTQKILDRLRPLEKDGAISELQVLQQQNTLESQKDELLRLNTQREQIINESKIRVAKLKGRLRQANNQLENEILLSPITGTVFNLIPDNDNYVTRNAEALMKIVPTGKLGANVDITNKDIGFIKTGQKVKVRVDSFPYTEYGEIEGTISNIGADALKPTDTIRAYHFPVSISLGKSELKTREGIIIPLQAGMTINTNLKLRDRRLIELLSDILTDRGESLKRLRKP